MCQEDVSDHLLAVDRICSAEKERIARTVGWRNAATLAATSAVFLVFLGLMVWAVLHEEALTSARSVKFVA